MIKELMRPDLLYDIVHRGNLRNLESKVNAMIIAGDIDRFSPWLW